MNASGTKAGEVSRFEAGLRNLAILSAAAAQQKGNEFSAKTTFASVESVLRKCLLPLLEAAGNLLQADELDPIAWAEAKAALRKELEPWLTKGE